MFLIDPFLQENLLKTMFQLEDTYFSLACTQKRNCLVICDRGAMDASAYLPREEWEGILEKNSLNEVDIRDNRCKYSTIWILNLKYRVFFFTGPPLTLLKRSSIN